VNDAFEPVKRASLAEQVAEQVRRMILDGRLRPGDRIPSERDLSERVGSNRNTVREAIRTLEQLQLVRVRQGDGVVVRDFRREGDLGLLPFFLSESPDGAEVVRVLGDILRMRRIVAGEAAALAAERAEGEDVAKLESLLPVEGSAGGEVPAEAEVWRRDLAFFRALVEASRSLVAVWLFNTFSRAFTGVMERVPGLWVEAEGYERVLKRLVSAVRRHRPAEARRVLERYYEGVDRRVLGALGGLQGATG
jgi:GntR family transcriptional repressor for pyruvate dehydrogenase complex